MDSLRRLVGLHHLAERILTGQVVAHEPPSGVGPPVLSAGFYCLHTGDTGRHAAQTALGVLRARGQTARLVDRMAVTSVDLVVALSAMKPFEVVQVDAKRRVRARIDRLDCLGGLLDG